MRLVSFDTETHMSQPGLAAPPMVCGTWQVDGFEPQIALADAALCQLADFLANPEIEICGFHIAYDFAVAAARRPDLLPLIFAAYDAGRVFDGAIGQALIDIHDGLLFWNRLDNRKIGGADEGRYSLSYCERLHLGIDRTAQKEEGSDSWRRRYALLDGVPLAQWPVDAIKYPLEDAANTLGVTKAQKAIGLNLHNMAEQARAAWALHLSAVWGIRTDPKVTAEVVAEIEKAHGETVARFQALGWFGPDGKKVTAVIKRAVAAAFGADLAIPCPTCKGTGKVPSTKTKNLIQCAACDATGVDLSSCTAPRTDGGKLSTAEDTLKESDDSELEAFAEVASDRDWTTYRPILLQGVTVPINPETNVLVVTGRTSYRKPNLQNQPRKGRVRECYVPRPGSLMASVDYSTLELCTLSQVCLWWVGYSNMAEAINAGRDLHDQFAARIRALTYEEQHAQLKAGDKTAKNMRQLSKAPNFGLPGGLGAFKLVLYARQAYSASFCELSGRAQPGECGKVKITDERSGKRACAACVDVAKELRSLWFQEWPEVSDYHAIITTLTEGPLGGAVQVPGPEGPGAPGMGLTRGRCGFCDGANNGFQGLAARGGKTALYNVARLAYTDPSSPLWGVRPLVFIHDEILAEVPEPTAHEAAHAISDVMVATMREFTPDVTITAPPALMRQWFKGAEPTYLCPEHGRQVEPAAVCCTRRRLVPWEPKAKS